MSCRFLFAGSLHVQRFCRAMKSGSYSLPHSKAANGFFVDGNKGAFPSIHGTHRTPL
jgi:prepilin-type processing-associated H-X9-DG protein